MFRKRHLMLCACISAVFSSMAAAEPSIADEPKHSIADEPKASLLDGQSHEVRTRLGKFGPMANVKLPPFKVAPRFEGVTGYTDTGVPISRRKKMVLEQADKIVAEWEAQYRQALKEGRAKPRPKVKTQAEMWEEENKRILEEERLHGRKTTTNFIIPGMTPEQSRELREAKTGGVVIRGGVQVFTVLPTEEELANGTVKRIDPTPEQLSAMEARSRENQANAFTLKYKDSEFESKGAVDDVEDYFPDMNAQAADPAKKKVQNRPASRDVLNAFPDSARIERNPLPSTQTEKTKYPTGQNKGVPVSLNRQQRNGLKPLFGVDGLLDRGIQWLSGSTAAMAQETGEVKLELEANPMTGAFDAIARQLADDKKALDKRIQDKEGASSHAKGKSNELNEGNCDSCRLTAEDFDRAAQAAKAVSNRPEGKGITEGESKVIEDITAILSDPKHPASFINMLQQALEDNAVVEEKIPEARELLGMTDDKPMPSEATYIFVSYSLGDDVMNDILGRHSGRDDVTLIMRGIPQGVSLGEGIKHMQELASQFDPQPNIIIDPTMFSHYEVKTVPSVVRVNVSEGFLSKFNLESRMQGKGQPAHSPLIAKVDGLHNDEWLKQQIELEQCSEEKPCQFGQQGQVYQIDEPDMIEEMKKRFAQIDWEKKKNEAMKRYWTNQTFDELPLVEKSVVRVLDPSIHVVADINDANGNPIRRAGEVVNPLEARPFNSVLVIFNPTRETEMEAVVENVGLLRAKGYGNFIYMATAIDRSKSSEDKTWGPGWGHYEAVCDRLDSHVFMLTSEVKERWDIRATPTFVRADNESKQFIIEEVAPNEAQEVVTP